MKSKICVIGHLAKGLNLLDGQTVKTKIVTEELQNRFGEEQVLTVDTYGGRKTLFKSPIQTFRALKKSENVIIFPAHNGLRVYAPLLSFQKRFFKGRKIHYVVIGGWLPRFLKKRRYLAARLKKFDGIYVETSTMKKALEEKGFSNVYVMPNCKNLTVLSPDQLVYPASAPYKLCTFSRVMKEKGIETAVNAVKLVNESLGYQAFSLDIYGQVDSTQTEWFDNLQKNLPDYMRYCGCVDADKSVEVLREYFALLFPTHFYTEGIPGTIIDAYAAGIPVISARWESFSDVVDEGVTGIGYNFDDTEQFQKLLFDIAKNPETINSIKKNCLKKAQEYTPLTAIQVLVDQIERE